MTIYQNIRTSYLRGIKQKLELDMNGMPYKDGGPTIGTFFLSQKLSGNEWGQLSGSHMTKKASLVLTAHALQRVNTSLISVVY